MAARMILLAAMLVLAVASAFPVLGAEPAGSPGWWEPPPQIRPAVTRRIVVRKVVRRPIVIRRIVARRPPFHRHRRHAGHAGQWRVRCLILIFGCRP